MMRRIGFVRRELARASEKVASSTLASGLVRARNAALWRATTVFPVPADPDGGRSSNAPTGTRAHAPALLHRSLRGSGVLRRGVRMDLRVVSLRRALQVLRSP